MGVGRPRIGIGITRPSLGMNASASLKAAIPVAESRNLTESAAFVQRPPIAGRQAHDGSCSAQNCLSAGMLDERGPDTALAIRLGNGQRMQPGTIGTKKQLAGSHWLTIRPCDEHHAAGPSSVDQRGDSLQRCSPKRRREWPYGGMWNPLNSSILTTRRISRPAGRCRARVEAERWRSMAGKC